MFELLLATTPWDGPALWEYQCEGCQMKSYKKPGQQVVWYWGYVYVQLQSVSRNA